MIELLTATDNYILMLSLQSTLPLGLVMGVLGALVMLNKNYILSDFSVTGALIGALVAYTFFGSQIVPYTFACSFVFALLSMLFARALQSTKFSQAHITQPLLSAILFGIAVIVLKYLEANYGNYGLDLNSLIIGNANELTMYEVHIIWYVSACVLAVIFFAYKPLKIMIIDIDFAKTIRIFIPFYMLLMTLAFTSVITVSIQPIGSLFFVPVLIMPAISAKMFVKKDTSLIFVSSIFGLISAFGGSVISANNDIVSTGMGVVICAFALMLTSIMISKLFLSKSED